MIAVGGCYIYILLLLLCFLQILTTPTKAYNLRNRLVPLSSPEHLNSHDSELEDIESEQPPPIMSELACEALTEELQQMQVTGSGSYYYLAHRGTLTHPRC